MITSLFIGCIWVLLAVVTALLPMRRQLTLLLLAPVLLIWIGVDFGWIVAVLAAAAFVLMFRNPLRYFYARARGEKPGASEMMTPSLICAALWLLAANVMAMIPSKDNLWQRAYLLIGVGIPLLIWVAYQNGLWVGLIVLIVGMSMLRWPVIYLTPWAKRLEDRDG